MLVFSIYSSSLLSCSSTSSTPCSSLYRFSDCSLTVPNHHVLVPFHHGLPQNEVVMRTNIFFFHSWLCQSLQNTTSWRTMLSYQTKISHLNPWCLACTSSPRSPETSETGIEKNTYPSDTLELYNLYFFYSTKFSSDTTRPPQCTPLSSILFRSNQRKKYTST